MSSLVCVDYKECLQLLDTVMEKEPPPPPKPPKRMFFFNVPYHHTHSVTTPVTLSRNFEIPVGTMRNQSNDISSGGTTQNTQIKTKSGKYIS